ncbi:unnamed protein product [Cyprideis torosa]|uniref:Uncharacterized protein n=1 Tax=Cyprideis torosa TaxID=163714 RepID=A0A7R8ZQQ6_9CRUS|nr:unnamed protein product [Cyprideis torosa]CAG0891256.1 unnamed protein product [Cyprideis torosa]
MSKHSKLGKFHLGGEEEMSGTTAEARRRLPALASGERHTVRRADSDSDDGKCNYGQSGSSAFRVLAEAAGICIAKEDSIPTGAQDDAIFDEVLQRLLEEENARVVVCFCEGETAGGLLQAIKRKGLAGHFMLVGSDGWADRWDVVDEVKEEALGALTVRIHTAIVPEFKNHYLALNPFNNSRNPWFQEFWAYKFNCTFDIAGSDRTAVINNCTGEEDLSVEYKQDHKLAFVIKAIMTMAHGLHNMQADVCGDVSAGLCDQLKTFDGAKFMKDYLMNVSFLYQAEKKDERVMFDSSGDPPGRYDIVNFVKREDGSYDYVHLGDWYNGSLSFFREKSLFVHPAVETGLVESVCSKPCPPGEKRSGGQEGGQEMCCWVCVPCRENQFLLNQTTCMDCEPGFWPNEEKLGCEAIDVEMIQWEDTPAIITIILSVHGLLATVFAAVVFICYNNTPVVKSSTRELSYTIFTGIAICCLTTFPILATPSAVMCTATRILPGLAFALIYASLFTKTYRIARVLANDSNKQISKSTRYLYNEWLVIYTIIIILPEIGIVFGMLVFQPAHETLKYPTLERVIRVCNTSTEAIMAPLGYDFLLLLLCTIYAIKTRKVPANYNEAKFIGFAVYTTLVIWVAFIPIYFNSDEFASAIALCICISLSGLVTLVLLFLPKMYIILFRPEKNSRQYFMTTVADRSMRGFNVGNNCNSINSCSDVSVNRGRGSTTSFETRYSVGMSPDHQRSLLNRWNQSSSKSRFSTECHPRSQLKRPVPAGLVQRTLSSPTSRLGLQSSSKSLSTKQRGLSEQERREQRIAELLDKSYGSHLDKQDRAIQTPDSMLREMLERIYEGKSLRPLPPSYRSMQDQHVPRPLYGLIREESASDRGEEEDEDEDDADRPPDSATGSPEVDPLKLKRKRSQFRKIFIDLPPFNENDSQHAISAKPKEHSAIIESPAAEAEATEPSPPPPDP